MTEGNSASPPSITSTSNRPPCAVSRTRSISWTCSNGKVTRLKPCPERSGKPRARMNLLLREDSGRCSEYRLNPRPCSGPTHDTTDRDSFWPVAMVTIADSAQLDEAKRELIQLTEDVVEDIRLAGHAYYANYEFDQALAAYQEGLRYVSKQAMPTLWATLMIDIANTQRYIAVRSEEESLHQHFRAAAVALRDACTVTRKRISQSCGSRSRITWGTRSRKTACAPAGRRVQNSSARPTRPIVRPSQSLQLRRRTKQRDGWMWLHHQLLR